MILHVSSLSFNIIDIIPTSVTQARTIFKNEWNKTKILRRTALYEKLKNNELTNDEILKKIIKEENKIAQEKIFNLIQNNLALFNYPDLPISDYSLLENNQQPNLITEELNYNQDEINQTLLNLDKLNSNQKLIFDTIIKLINSKIN